MRLDNTFEVWWQNLKSQLDELDIEADKSFIRDEKQNNREHSKELLNEMVEEILERIRSQEEILRSPDKLLPRNYLRYSLEGFGFNVKDKITERYFSDTLERMNYVVRKYENDKLIPKEVFIELIRNMERLFNLIRK